jgi:hypothetical protein
MVTAENTLAEGIEGDFVHTVLLRVYVEWLFSSATPSARTGRGFAAFLAAATGMTGHAPGRLQGKRGSRKYPIHFGTAADFTLYFFIISNAYQIL